MRSEENAITLYYYLLSLRLSLFCRISLFLGLLFIYLLHFFGPVITHRHALGSAHQNCSVHRRSEERREGGKEGGVRGIDERGY